MIAPKLPQTSLYMGSSSTPIVFAEIIPIVLVANDLGRGSIQQAAESLDHRQPPIHLTNFGAKQFLIRETREADAVAMSDFTSESDDRNQFFIRWMEETDDDEINSISSGYLFQNKKKQSEDLCQPVTCSVADGRFPLTYIPSDNPTIMNHQPCCIIAYAHRNVVGRNFGGPSKNQLHSSMCQISPETLIRILPPRLATKSMPFDRLGFESRSLLTASPFSSSHFRRDSMLHDLVGDDGGNKMTDEMIEELLQYHDEETIQELTLKISATVTSVRIGTTQDAFLSREKQEKQMRNIEQSIRLFSRALSQKDADLTTDNNDGTGLQPWPSIIVHSPNHADGKTLLVHAIAKRLGCSSIHLIRPGALLAKYSTRADAALESQLHAILVSAACRNQKVCIILDQLDTLLPARLSGRTNSGDSAIPIFNSIASYLRKLTDSMQRKREFPFPLKNPLYNPAGSDSNSGQVFSVEFCLVGIVTCPDDGWRSRQKNDGGSAASILDCMIGDRYRMPLLKAKTILSAFSAAFEREGITIEESAQLRLAAIVSSASWAKGSVFRRVAKQLKWILMNDSIDHTCSDDSIRSQAKIQDLEQALALINPNISRSTKLQDSIEMETSQDGKIHASPAHFGSIGGNENAKVSLEDALAFNPEKRKILFRFGLSPPTGVLLYGPPGCGKTLLAKAVARMFESPVPGTSQSLVQGGTFISLSISEIVSSEVGTSEKTIASSFEFAGKNAPSVSSVVVSNLCLLCRFFLP